MDMHVYVGVGFVCFFLGWIFGKESSWALLNSTEFTILALLSRRSDGAAGLKLVSLSSFQLYRGTIYTHLVRMEEKELVESFMPEDGNRRHYRATKTGLRVLGRHNDRAGKD